MVKCPLILLISHPIGFCLAWSWAAHQTPHSGEGQIPPDMSSGLVDSELLQSDIDALLKSRDTLQSYQRKPDCFRDAISLVKAHCEESHMDEQERVQAAISMTMCELATARHYSPPMECAGFARGGYKLSSSSPPAHARGQCVEALSRSAQFWSSYSGYLREIPQLCFAFRRWIDIDTAKDIYRNITIDKVTLLRFLTEREKNSRGAQQIWEQTTQDMRDVLDALRLTSSGVRDASDLLTVIVNSGFQSLLAEIENELREVGQRERTDHAEIMAKFNDILGAVGREHSDHLAGLLPSIRSSIASELSTVFALIKDESLRNLDVAELIQRQLGSLGGSLASMENSVQQLVGRIEDTSKLLESSLMQAQTAQSIQGDAMLSMSHFVETLDLLTQTTHAELEAINRTTTALTDSLKQSASSAWLKSALVSLFQLLPGMSQFDFVLSSQTLHLALRLINILWHTIRFSVSLLMSAFVLINAKRWMPSRGRIPSETKGISLSHPTQCVGPRTKTSHRLFRPRYSRIPDRLCRPSEHSAWP
ncbi:hypothetical protein BS17DRAFT_298547 [Gyrodon lividus]|nr:hypothetical protein BS17DRAFT_298547 [Gyrodon lividus]